MIATACVATCPTYRIHWSVTSTLADRNWHSSVWHALICEKCDCPNTSLARRKRFPYYRQLSVPRQDVTHTLRRWALTLEEPAQQVRACSNISLLILWHRMISVGEANRPSRGDWLFGVIKQPGQRCFPLTWLLMVGKIIYLYWFSALSNTF